MRLRALLWLVVALSGWSLQVQGQSADELVAVIETSRGTMEFTLRPDIAPLTVANFVNLAMRGFYNRLTFHRVEQSFMAQGGDPSGDGTGGPGYAFKDEIALKLNQEGILAMANSGPNSNGSQFFITHKEAPHLNGVHTVFGLIRSGKQVIRQIKIGDTITTIRIVGDPKPLLEANRAQVEEWNKILEKRYLNLAPSPLPTTPGT